MNQGQCSSLALDQFVVVIICSGYAAGDLIVDEEL